MVTLLFIWFAVGIGLTCIVCRGHKGSAGMPLAYFLALSLIHLPGAILYLDADGSNVTTIGFEQTTIGAVAFLVGVIIARYAFVRPLAEQPSAGQTQDFTRLRVTKLDRLALVYVLVGSVAFFVLMPLAASIPSATSLVSPLGSLILVGACIRLWVASESRDWLKYWSTMALLPVLPLATLLQGGFLGFGTGWALAIVTFCFAQSKRKLIYLLLAPAVFFGGLSIFVNYMAARGEFRQLVWHQQVSIGDRLSRVADVFRDFEWLDLSNFRHRQAIDDRLNQNQYIGIAVERLELGAVEYASGDTLGKAAIALIPRLIWPNKPAVGGGGSVVHDFTGIEFAQGTSIGAGQVFEFYVNFGSLGVIVGFLLYGLLAGRMDLSVIKYLRQGDQQRLLLWFLPCMALLQPGGNLLEIIVGMVSSAITAYSIGYLLPRDFRRGPTRTRQTALGTVSPR